MFKKVFSFLFIVMFGTVSTVYSQTFSPTVPASNGPTAPLLDQLGNMAQTIPPAPNIDARSYVLMDANSGMILAQKNMDQRLPPASLTKMMTLYLASQALYNGTVQLDTQVPISKKAWQMGGSKMFVKVGTIVAMKDLLQGIIVDSGNDACVATAEYLGGAEDTFVNMMNTQAQNLGLANTHYTDCTGMPNPSHYTTAKDLTTLARALIINFPQYYLDWYNQKWFTYNKIRQPNRNRLLWRYPEADGIKTGHTDEAGFCLVASAKRNNTRLIATILGAPTDEKRASETINLLNYGFRFYSSYLVYTANSAVTTARIWYGANKTVPAGVLQDFYVTVPVNQFQGIKTSFTVQPRLKGPIKKGQTVGTVIVTLKDQPIATHDLQALEDDPAGSTWRKLMDSITHWFYRQK